MRSAFEGNVVVSADAQEAILDYAFERLRLRGGRVAHPLLLTEPLLAPPSSRARLAELAFETYGVPSLALGADAAFAWAAAASSGAVPRHAGTVAAAGHTACHVLPLLDGAPVLSAAVRLAPGGLAVTEHLAHLLSLRYPAFTAVPGGALARAEELKHALCHVALDYAAEARGYAAAQRAAAAARWNAGDDGDADALGGGGGGGGGGGVFAPGRLARVQLPWAPQRAGAGAGPPAPPTEEELARKAEQRRAAVRFARLSDRTHAPISLVPLSSPAGRPPACHVRRAARRQGGGARR